MCGFDQSRAVFREVDIKQLLQLAVAIDLDHVDPLVTGKEFFYVIKER